MLRALLLTAACAASLAGQAPPGCHARRSRSHLCPEIGLRHHHREASSAKTPGCSTVLPAGSRRTRRFGRPRRNRIAWVVICSVIQPRRLRCEVGRLAGAPRRRVSIIRSLKSLPAERRGVGPCNRPRTAAGGRLER